MSLEMLSEMEVFEHRTISPALIRYLYKPYYELTDEDTEKNLVDAVKANKKVILRSWQGSGKSCVINYSVSMLDQCYFPISIKIRLAGPQDELCSNASEFVKFVLSRILMAVKEAKKIDKRLYNQYRKFLSGDFSYKKAKKETIIGKIASKLSWIPGFAETSAEVGAQTEEYIEYALREKVFVVDQVGCINEVVRICTNKNITPIIVLDDTDKFLKRGRIDNTPLIESFFQYIAPFIAEMECPVVFPTHQTYIDYDIYRNAEKNNFDEVITIPEMTFQAFEQMIDHKVRSVISDGKAIDYINRDALELAYKHFYRGTKEERLRNTILAINGAVKEAGRRNEPKVDKEMMYSQLLDLSFIKS